MEPGMRRAACVVGGDAGVKNRKWDIFTYKHSKWHCLHFLSWHCLLLPVLVLQTMDIGHWSHWGSPSLLGEKE